MPINYKIAADVVDIQIDSPTEQDLFLVDTNVWYWMTYTRASLVGQQQTHPRIRDYPSFVNKALATNAQLYRCGLTLPELAHIIERSEREIFERRNGREFKPKQYRHNYPAERSNVVTEVESAWGQVKTMAAPLDILIDKTLTDSALSRFKKECLDGYDLFILEAMFSKKIIQIITDDGDFATVPGITVFTANHNVITAARQQSKLLIR